MDLNLLAVFVKVADAASFAAAERQLGQRRSSISRAIGSLEKDLGVQLFNRTTRAVALTTAGAELHARVATQLAALREAAEGLPDRQPARRACIGSYDFAIGNLAYRALRTTSWQIAPIVIAEQARVALEEEIGQARSSPFTSVLLKDDSESCPTLICGMKAKWRFKGLST